MSTSILDLENSASWNLVWVQNFQAQRVPTATSRYYPIPVIEMPLQLESHIFAVEVTSATAPRNWRFAGYMNQRISAGILGGGTADAEIASSRKLFLNRISLFRFPKLTTTFSLTFSVPYWFEDIRYQLWEYTGINNDSTEELISEIKQVDIPRLENKIDEIKQTVMGLTEITQLQDELQEIIDAINNEQP